MPDHAPAKEHGFHLSGARCALGHDLELAGIDWLMIAVLHEYAPDDGTNFAERVGS